MFRGREHTGPSRATWRGRDDCESKDVSYASPAIGWTALYLPAGARGHAVLCATAAARATGVGAQDSTGSAGFPRGADCAVSGPAAGADAGGVDVSSRDY